MKLLTTLCLINIMLLVSSCGASHNVTKEDEQAILSFVAESDEAFAEKKLNLHLYYFNEDTVFNFEDPEDGGMFTGNYENYKDLISLSIIDLKRYEEKRNNETVRAGKNGIIIYESDIFSKYHLNGENFDDTSHEVWEFIRVEGGYKVMTFTSTYL